MTISSLTEFLTLMMMIKMIIMTTIVILMIFTSIATNTLKLFLGKRLQWEWDLGLGYDD